MSHSVRRVLVLIMALVYTIFACNYMLLCKRNISVVNLVRGRYSLVSKQRAGTIPIIKNSSSQRPPVSNKFLSKPRVITNRLNLPDFSILAFTFLLLFTLFAKKRQSFFVIDFLSYPDRCPGIVFFGNWRI